MDPTRVGKNVCHIPKLCINKIYVYKISKIPKYALYYNDYDFLLLKKVSNKRIELDKVVNGHYYIIEIGKIVYIKDNSPSTKDLKTLHKRWD